MSNQQQFLDVIDLEFAQQRFNEAISPSPLREESVPLNQALGRVLASNVLSPVNVPSFDRSNFDGYALQAKATYGASEEQPRSLELTDEPIKTAQTPTQVVSHDSALPIATGAMLPRGADAVLMVEDADVIEGKLYIRRGIASGHGVAFAGTDISQGELLLTMGTLLTSRETGVLAAVGLETVSVYGRPKVAVISTGDEIIPPGAEMRPGFVFDSNARVISDTVRELGAEPIEMGIAIDSDVELRALLERAIQETDVIVLSGGTSKGEGDISYRVVQERHDPGVIVHGVALKPGKPICLAASEGKPIIILPGFPTSAIFTFHEFVAPVIRRLGGQPDPRHGKLTAELSTRINSTIGRTEYVLVGLVPADKKEDESAEKSTHGWHAFPMGKGSGSVTTFSHADGYMTVDRHDELVEAGTQVEVQLLSRELRPADLVIVGSHCVGLDLLASKLRSQGLETKFMSVGSTGGIDAVRRNQCDLAGTHLLDESTGKYNEAFMTEDMTLVKGYRRKQGIVFRIDDQRFQYRDAAGMRQEITSNADCMMVNRNMGSGTRLIVDQFLDGEQPAGYSVQARNHTAVAAAVAQRRADWGIAIEQVARDAGLGFLPMQDEEFDFAISKSRIERAAVKAFLQLLEQDEVRQELARMGLFIERDVQR